MKLSRVETFKPFCNLTLIALGGVRSVRLLVTGRYGPRIPLPVPPSGSAGEVLLKAVTCDPGDSVSRQALADWCMEEDQPGIGQMLAGLGNRDDLWLTVSCYFAAFIHRPSLGWDETVVVLPERHLSEIADLARGERLNVMCQKVGSVPRRQVRRHREMVLEGIPAEFDPLASLMGMWFGKGGAA